VFPLELESVLPSESEFPLELESVFPSESEFPLALESESEFPWESE
jgi:hypothetical protein